MFSYLSVPTLQFLWLQQCRSAYGLGWGYYAEGDQPEAPGVCGVDVVDADCTQIAPPLPCSADDTCDGGAVRTSVFSVECNTSDVHIVSTAGSDVTDAIPQIEGTDDSTNTNTDTDIDGGAGDDKMVIQNNEHDRDVTEKEVGRDELKNDSCGDENEKDGDVNGNTTSQSNSGGDGWYGGPVGVCLDLSYHDVMTHRTLSGKDRGRWRLEKKGEVPDSSPSQSTDPTMLLEEESGVELGPGSGPGSVLITTLSPAQIPSVPHLSGFPRMSQYNIDVKAEKALILKTKRTNQRKAKLLLASNAKEWGLKSNGESLAIAGNHDPWLSLCATDFQDIMHRNVLEKIPEDSVVSADESSNNSWTWDFMSNVVNEKNYHTDSNKVPHTVLACCMILLK